MFRKKRSLINSDLFLPSVKLPLNNTVFKNQ